MKQFLFFLSLVLLSLPLFGTGPSAVDALIRPISINEKGEILCITMFEQNEMGAHRGMPVEYGLCVLKDKSIDYFKVFVLDDEERLDETIDYWIEREKWNRTFDKAGINTASKWMSNSFKSKYDFKENNVKKYKKNFKTTVRQIVEKYNINTNSVFLNALRGEKGYFTEEKMDYEIKILYDFGNVILLDNCYNGDELEIGLDFNYHNSLFPEVGFETYHVTGVLFVE